MDLLLGERPEGDGTEQAYPDALLTGTLNALLGDARRTAERHDHILRVVHQRGLVAHLRLPYLPVFLLQGDIALLHHLGLQLQRREDVGLARLGPAHRCPGTLPGNLLLRAAGLHGWQHHLLHHLSDDTVAEDHRRIAVLESQLEGEVHEVCHLLHRGGRQHDDIVVAVATAAGGLEIVTLRGLDGAQSGTASLHVDHHSGNLRTCHVGDALLHQRHTGTRRGGDDALACARPAMHHVDSRHLALRLQHHHAGGLPGLEQGERLYNLTLWCDGIAEEAIRPTSYTGMGYRLIAFHQCHFLFLCHCCQSSFFR